MTAPDKLTRLDQIKVSVIGTGSLGKEHSRIYAELAAAGGVDFIGVYDAAPDASRKSATGCGHSPLRQKPPQPAML
jgi:hypothetical protein